MTGRAKVWLVLAVLFFLVNAWGAWYALVHHEPIHCLIHVALLLPGGWLVWRLLSRRAAAGY